MSRQTDPTRRRVLRLGAAVGAAGVATTFAGAASAAPGACNGKGDDASAQGEDNRKTFGRVYANGTLWRTNVVKVLDSEPDPADAIYFLHDGSKPIVANADAGDAQASPFVSESAPGDRDWNGGKWVHYSAEVTDVDAFAADAPFDDEADVLGADYVEVTKGRPGFGPPNFFICPLNGRA